MKDEAALELAKQIAELARSNLVLATAVNSMVDIIRRADASIGVIREKVEYIHTHTKPRRLKVAR